jgi:predicted O-methyltransferase YrrM
MAFALRKLRRLGDTKLARESIGGLARLFSNPELSRTLASLEKSKSDTNISELLRLQRRPGQIETAWLGLGSIGYELVAHFKPKCVVELGSYGGFSTASLALALKKHVQGGKLFAVDTWAGDFHAGFYSESVFSQFQTFRSELELTEVIEPMRMTFEEAAGLIKGPVDMLHIDGWHTFQAVKRDLALFKPVLSSPATVIFHDVNTHFLGMRLFWLQLALRHKTALIPYSHGLGVARV